MIEIIMATYNGERFIREQLDSIFAQTHTDWKLLVRDDGSSDKTVEIIREYEAKYPDKIELVKNSSEDTSGLENASEKGAKTNFFKLLQKTTAEYVMFADQDDFWEPDKVKRAYECMLVTESLVGSDKPVLCHGDLKVVDGKLGSINPSMADMQKLDLNKGELNHILVQNNVTGCTMIINRALADMCDYMPEKAIMHDWWLALIAAAFGKISCIGDAGIKYRQHGNNSVAAKNLKSVKYMVKKIASGEDVKQSLNATYEQAEAFLKVFKKKLAGDKAKIVKAYITIPKVGKLDKIRLIKKYGFMKTGLARKLGYILYI